MRDATPPTLLIDGDCGFCRRSARRVARLTGDRVRIDAYQDVVAEFPEVDPAACAQAVHLVEGDGRARRVSRGAEAVFGAMARASGWAPLAWAYRWVPLFAPLSEFAYRLVAESRLRLSRVELFLTGLNREPASHQRVRGLYLRLLGLVYALAFASLFTQVLGLFGSEGILPAAELLDTVGGQAQAEGASRWARLPTLLWWGAGDAALRLLCVAGIVLGVACALGLTPKPILLALFGLYLSLVNAGRVFLWFQWDSLLLEAGFAALFLAPWSWRPSRARAEPVPLLGLWLARWLLFRFMLLSGAVKLLWDDPLWLDGSALSLHHWTQPLPHAGGWLAHQLPAWFQRLSCWVMYAIELGLPFLALGPRRPRLLACAGFVLLQFMIAATGNYGFFNLLTVALCVPLLDDATLARLVPRRWRPAAPEFRPLGRCAGWTRTLLAPAALALMALGGVEALDTLRHPGGFEGPEWVETARRRAAPLHLAQSYGLFRVMTTDRWEIRIEGSDDGETWEPYPSRWKADEVDDPPRWVQPHMPRLDWQLWFAALVPRRAGGEAVPWFPPLCVRLLEGSDAVEDLFAANPFPDAPPRYVRASWARFEFTSFGEQGWWRRSAWYEFLAPVTLAPDGRLGWAQGLSSARRLSAPHGEVQTTIGVGALD